MLPDVAPAGTGTETLVSPQVLGVASVPLKLTVLVPFVAPKFVPVTVTGVPTRPLTGASDERCGGGMTVIGAPLLA
jgi:hypothetical protein